MTPLDDARKELQDSLREPTLARELRRTYAKLADASGNVLFAGQPPPSEAQRKLWIDMSHGSPNEHFDLYLSLLLTAVPEEEQARWMESIRIAYVESFGVISRIKQVKDGYIVLLPASLLLLYSKLLHILHDARHAEKPLPRFFNPVVELGALLVLGVTEFWQLLRGLIQGDADDLGRALQIYSTASPGLGVRADTLLIAHELAHALRGHYATNYAPVLPRCVRAGRRDWAREIEADAAGLALCLCMEQGVLLAHDLTPDDSEYQRRLVESMRQYNAAAMTLFNLYAVLETLTRPLRLRWHLVRSHPPAQRRYRAYRAYARDMMKEFHPSPPAAESRMSRITHAAFRSLLCAKLRRSFRHPFEEGSDAERFRSLSLFL